MQVSLAFAAYRKMVQRAFKEVLLASRQFDTVPDISRMTQFLTRLKDENPVLDNPALCETGLPDHWAYFQFARGPLEILE